MYVGAVATCTHLPCACMLCPDMLQCYIDIHKYLTCTYMYMYMGIHMHLFVSCVYFILPYSAPITFFFLRTPWHDFGMRDQPIGHTVPLAVVHCSQW